MKGQWRYSDTKIVEVDFRGPGVDKQPFRPTVPGLMTTRHMPAVLTLMIQEWEVISPTTLDQRRGNGRLGIQLVSHQADNS